MRVLLSGYYGYSNIGDEAILQAIIQGLRQHVPEIKLTVLSARPRLTRKVNQVEVLYRYNLPGIILKLWRCQVFVSGGGTLFQNATSQRSFLYYLGLIFLAKLMRKRVAVFAQGFGPLTGKFNRFLAKFILNKVELITVRDQAAHQAITNLEINKPQLALTADPTLILPCPEVKQATPPLRVGIVVRGIKDKMVEGKLFKALSQATEWLTGSRGYIPVFFVFGQLDDEKATNRIINYIPGKPGEIIKTDQPAEMLAAIAELDLLIGMRLHALIFAASCAVPLLGISYDPKVEAFMKTVSQPCLKLDQKLDFQLFKDRLELILNNQDKIKHNLFEKKELLKKQALMNFELFFKHFEPASKK